MTESIIFYTIVLIVMPWFIVGVFYTLILLKETLLGFFKG